MTNDGSARDRDRLDADLVDPERVIVQTVVVREIMTTYECLDEVSAKAEAWARSVFERVDGLIGLKVTSLSVPADYEHRLDDDAGLLPIADAEPRV